MATSIGKYQMRTLPLYVWLALPTVLACTKDLSGPFTELQLTLSATSVVDSAAVASTAERLVVIHIGASDSGSHDWTVTSAGGAWLGLSALSGQTPTALSVTLVPDGLAIGSYVDTLVFDAQGVAEMAVMPIRFAIHECRKSSLNFGAIVSSVITGSDCGAPRRASRLADVYTFQGTVGDSISIIMESAVLDPYLILDSVASGDSPSLFESESCPGTGNAACVLDFSLPYTGTYFVEATTVGAGEVGSYTIDVSPPRSPDLPMLLRQLQVDSSTNIPIGFSSHTSMATLSAIVTDADAFNRLRLQVELREVGVPFTGTSTAESAPSSNGSSAYVSVAELAENASYHWQARVVDNTGRASDWSGFGGNNETDTDFRGPPSGATHLQFVVHPANTDVGMTMTPAVQVAVLDAGGTLVPDYPNEISVNIVSGTGSPGALLNGTLSRLAVDGVAVFPDLEVTTAGIGYRLNAASTGLPSIQSDAFDVRGSAPTFVLFAQGFSDPILVTSAPNDVERVFVVEQDGVIRIVRDAETLATPFLDISGAISGGGEQGLLGMAFDPDFAANGRFFVNHTGADGETRIVRYTVSGNPDVADPASADTLLIVGQPFSNHNAGHMAFGPDGLLYIALGDGGSGGDPQGHGQDLTTLLGNLLRIDVSGGVGYQIPPDNPYVSDVNARSEIWISGLRNPWRFSFDGVTGDLYVADVGQGSWEEVTVQPTSSGGGENFGWNVMEGAHCFQPASGCNQAGLTLPVLEYSHAEGCSITGGYVYRGDRLPELVGHYLYSDYCSGWIRSFRLEAGVATDAIQWSTPFSGNVTSFGEDALGNVYVVLQDGRIFRIE